jgi:hypothetical protein
VLRVVNKAREMDPLYTRVTLQNVGDPRGVCTLPLEAQA